ncbi:MAG: ABC transporter permease [Desulfovibrionaceae bacterium]
MGILGEVALALRLARRELRTGLRGFGVFLSCLALGVAAVAGVKSLATAYDAGLVRDASALLGGDVEVSLPLRPASVDELAALTARGHVSHVLSLRIMARRDAPGAKPTLASLRAVDAAYPLYGQVVLDPPLPLDAVLAQRDGLPGAAVSPQLLDRLGAKVGERIRLADAEFVIRAVLTREPDAAAGLAASLGPPILISSSQLAASGLSGPGLIARHAYRLKLPPGVSAAVARELREGFPEAGWRVRDASGAQPGLSRIMDRLTAIMGLVGLTALLLGGIGIAQAVASYLDGRTSSIAAMKCLGAPTRVVTWTYLTVVLTLAVGGIVPGLALGALLPALVAPLLDTVSPAALVVGLHGQALALAACFGLLTVLTFSLPALAGAARIAPLSLLRGQVAADLPRLGVRVFLPAMVCALALASLTVATTPDRRLGLGFVGAVVTAVGVFQLFGLLTTRLARLVPRRRPGRVAVALRALGRPGNRQAGRILAALGLGLSILCALGQVDANFAQALVSDIPRRAPAFFFPGYPARAT